MAEDREFIYAVTRVHMQEAHLLNKQALEQLAQADSADEIFRFLRERGWGAADTPPGNVDALITAEMLKTWQLIEELAGDIRYFDVFRISNDYHNLKAAIKLAYTANEEDAREQYFLPFGTVDAKRLQAAANSRDYSDLPAALAQTGSRAYETLSRSANGQLCDMIIDRAALIAIDAAGKSAKIPLLKRYAEIVVDGANIKAAMRCARMGKTREFAELAIAPAGTLDYTALLNAATAENNEEFLSYLETTAYSHAGEALRQSMAAFECWCDNEIIRMIRPQRTNYFGFEPLAAFVLGRENEIRMVRLILSVKANELSNDVLRERLRETYV